MFSQGSKAIAIPAINLITSIRPTSLIALSKLTELQSTAAHRKSGACRSHSSLGKNGRKYIQNERMTPNRTKVRASFVNLKEARRSMNEILSQLSKLDLTPASFSVESIPAGEKNEKELLKILQDTKDFLHSLIGSVDQGLLNPSGKHGKELSKFLELVLFAYSQIHLPDLALFDDCQEVLNTLKKWNLDVRSRHYDYAIAAANREARWKEASNLFWRQINPEAGYNPVNVSISKPHGLYAIARRAQEEDSAVAEHVFDAVMQLTMVSPYDQPTYILAAGTALGHAGEWKSAMEYLETSFTASQLGQPLVVSVMQACLLSDRAEDALRAFEDGIGDPQSTVAGEWQWGGEMDRLDPLCRDLAMRVMMSRDGMSAAALQFFRQSLGEGVTISLEALRGVVEACEQDLDSEGAVSVLLTILENADRMNWIVPGSEMSIDDCDSTEASNFSGGTVAERWLPEMGDILASVMRTCNLTSSFGTALFCLRLVDLSLSCTQKGSLRRDMDANLCLEQSIGSMLSRVQSSEDLLIPTMVSLCGLRCCNHAIQLFESVQDSRPLESQIDEDSIISDAQPVYEYALSENARHGPTLLGNPWVSAHRHVYRLSAAVHLIKKSNRDLTPAEHDMIQAALATAMNACTSAHQPALSLLLMSWVGNLAGSPLESSTGDKMKSYLGMNDTVDTNDFAMNRDSLFAEVIIAHRWSKNFAVAIDLFQSLLDSKRDEELDQWKLSCNAGLSALIANGRGNDAVEIFKATNHSALTTDSYTTIARFLAKERNWKELIDLYRSALEHGYLSEELSLLAMNAVVSSKVDNRMRIIRAIVDDNAKSVSMHPISWTRTRYWHVKRALGFHHARLLMWWNDPETCHLDELDLAIEEFDEQRATGLKAKNDVVRAIVANAISFDDALLAIETTKWQRVPFSTKDWVSLLQEVLHEIRSSGIRYDARFIDDVVEACRNLGCSRECVEFMTDVLNRGVRVNRKALLAALEAAKEEHSVDLANDIQMLILGSPSQTRE